MHNHEIHDKIAKEAYARYLRRGMVPGHDLQDWLRTEKGALAGSRSRPGEAPARPVRRGPSNA